jgi:hypothetical protein
LDFHDLGLNIDWIERLSVPIDEIFVFFMVRVGHGLKEHFEAWSATDILGRCAPFPVDLGRQTSTGWYIEQSFHYLSDQKLDFRPLSSVSKRA